MAPLFIAIEHMANGIAQREVWLEIRLVDDIANPMQVASRKNPVLQKTSVIQPTQTKRQMRALSD